MASTRILLGIVTGERVGDLLELIETLASLKAPRGSEVVALVASAVGKTSLPAVAVEAGARLPFILAGAPPAGSVPEARNRLLETARKEGADLLALLDDGLHPQSDWLKELVALKQQYEAGIVIARAEPVLPAGAPLWTEFSRTLRHDPNAAQIRFGPDLTARSVLIDLAEPALGDLAFEARYARAGGSLAAYLHAADRAGIRIIFGGSAIARTALAPGRLKLSAEARVERHDIALTTYFDRRDHGVWRTAARRLPDALGNIVIGGVLRLAGLFGDDASKVASRRRLSRLPGTLAGLFGWLPRRP